MLVNCTGCSLKPVSCSPNPKFPLSTQTAARGTPCYTCSPHSYFSHFYNILGLREIWIFQEYPNIQYGYIQYLDIPNIQYVDIPGCISPLALEIMARAGALLGDFSTFGKSHASSLIPKQIFLSVPTDRRDGLKVFSALCIN